MKSHLTIFKKVVIGVMVILGIVFFILCVLFIRQYREISSLHVITGKNLWNHARMSRHLSVSDVVFIQPWMTFEYLNHSFGIPDDYLCSKLDITDPRYPRLVIERTALASGQDPNVYVDKIKDAITAYFNGISK